MAITVNDVYTTVLTILNKEQRGYMTPTEFNKVSSQVQREIFEKYFEDLNQFERMPQSEADYSNRIIAIQEKLSPFNKIGTISPVTSNTNLYTLPTDHYKLGAVTLTNTLTGKEVEVQRVTKGELYNINLSPITKPSKDAPLYSFEAGKIRIYAGQALETKVDTVVIKANYIKEPSDVVWNFNTGTLGQYTHSTSGSVDFELDISEQPNVILRVLLYAGVTLQEAQVMSTAAGIINKEEQNEKR